LLVVDRGNRRVLLYDTIPTTNFTAADMVFGQDNMTTVASTLAVGSKTFGRPEYIWCNKDAAFIGDSLFNRMSAIGLPEP
jgi:hypothetical protein